MIGWRTHHKRVAPVVVASMLSSAVIAAMAVPPGMVAAATDPGQLNLAVSDVRTQQDDQPPVTQVGEGAQGDSETLDEGAPPTQAASTGNEDVETLDQGSPPTSAPAPAPTASTAPAPVYEAAAPASPATTYVAPQTNMRTGPVLPPGFGMGRVHVSAGRFGFPAGLEACHVGAVTGRAFVGLDCGDGDDVVGHARSFDDFPFVPEVDFPFEGDEAFFSDSGVFADNEDGSADDVIVSGGGISRGTANSSSPASDDSQPNSNDANSNNNSRNRDDTPSDGGSVSSAQRVRHREPRVRVTKAQSETSTQTESNSGKQAKKHGGKTTANNGHISQATKDDRSRQKSSAKAQHSGKKHKTKNGKNKKHDKHSKGGKRKKR